jgi:V/A-type H+-transporting ATPase subunit I
MIVKMSKYAFMVYHKEYDTFLSTLRDLGVVHIKETNSVMDNERLQELLAERKQINTLMRYFKNLHAAEKDVKFAPARELTKEEGLKLVRKIEELQDKKAQLIASKQSIEKDLAYMEIWGEFSYQNINRLKSLRYFICRILSVAIAQPICVQADMISTQPISFIISCSCFCK